MARVASRYLSGTLASLPTVLYVFRWKQPSPTLNLRGVDVLSPPIACHGEVSTPLFLRKEEPAARIFRCKRAPSLRRMYNRRGLRIDWKLVVPLPGVRISASNRFISQFSWKIFC